MHLVLAALICFGILTLWVPQYWPVTVFQIGNFALATFVVWRARRLPPRFAYPLVPLFFALVWGIFQMFAGLTAYPFETQRAIVHWTTFLAVSLTALGLFTDDDVRRWFRSVMLWFGFAVAVLATIQTFTSNGKVFWIFPTPYTDFVMGPILYRNHYAVFIEVVLPIALYEALRRERDSLPYSGMAGAMYASVVASASRAGTVLATAEILVVVAIMWARGRTTGRAIGGAVLRIALLLAVFTTVVGYDSVWKRFWAADPMAARREFAVSSIQMIKAHPWSGVGMGVWPTVYPRYAIIDVGGFANQAHNDWLQWTAEGGIPFGIVMLTLLLWCIRPAFRSVWGLGVVAVFLHATVDYPFSRPALGSWTFLMVAMLATKQTRSKAASELPR